VVTETISDAEFSRIQQVMFERVGVTIGSAKRALVVGRLSRRLRHFNLKSYTEYLKLVERQGSEGEWQVMMDLLTTHETYFFREPKHFEFLNRVIKERSSRRETFRVWSAACSSGEEAYSIAMTLADSAVSLDWQVFASDVSRRMVDESRQGVYPQSRVAKVSPSVLERHFLRGVRSQAGNYLVSADLRKRMEFHQMNLNENIDSEVGHFDFIFLRNVLIYFNAEQKKQIVKRLVAHLKYNGYLLVGHSETLNGVSDAVVATAPSIYQRRSVASSQQVAGMNG